MLTGVTVAAIGLATVAVDPALADPACRPAVAEQPDGTRAGVSCPDGPTGRPELQADSGGSRARVGTPASSENAAPELAPAPESAPQPPPRPRPAPAPPAPAVRPPKAEPAPAPVPGPAPAPQPPAAPGPPPPPPAPPPPAPPPPPQRVLAEAGPLTSPVRTAAIVAVLGVFVLTVSVGALSRAVRVR